MNTFMEFDLTERWRSGDKPGRKIMIRMDQIISFLPDSSRKTTEVLLTNGSEIDLFIDYTTFKLLVRQYCGDS